MDKLTQVAKEHVDLRLLDIRKLLDDNALPLYEYGLSFDKTGNEVFSHYLYPIGPSEEIHFWYSNNVWICEFVFLERHNNLISGERVIVLTGEQYDTAMELLEKIRVT